MKQAPAYLPLTEFLRNENTSASTHVKNLKRDTYEDGSLAFGENNFDLEFIGENALPNCDIVPAASRDMPLLLCSGGVASKLNLVAVSKTTGPCQTERARKD